MTKGNVGSLLVFDPSKVDLTAEMTKASGDAVVGLITERGARPAGVLMMMLSAGVLATAAYRDLPCTSCKLQTAGRQPQLSAFPWPHDSLGCAVLADPACGLD